MKIGDIIHIDVDNDEWGRVATDAKIIDILPNNMYLVNAYSIRANILVPDYECKI